MASPEQNQVVELERRQSKGVLAITLIGVLAVLAGTIVQSSGVSVDSTDDAARLVDRSTAFSSILAGSILSGIGFLLVAGTLIFLFSAVERRSEAIRSSLKPLLVIGPVLLALTNLATAIGYNSVASDFVAGGTTTGEEAINRASDLVSNSGLLQTAAFVGLAGLAAFVVGVIYTAQQAMRIGLLTRFWGTLGMAFGGAFLLSSVLGPIGFFGLLIWLVHVAVQARGLWPGGTLAAWETGTAVPWPDPRAPAPEPDAEESARPEDFEGSASEISDERPARRDNKRKRKRKQRG